MSALDPRALRDAFGTFITGVTVVTTLDTEGSPLGFTANSFTSVSLDPPLLLVCIDKSSSNLASFRCARGFAVNILSESQREVSQIFAKPVVDRFSSVTWRVGPHGSPVFDNVSAWFDCATHEVVDAGDHLILIGRIEVFDNSGANGLGYARGGYFTPSLEEQAVATAASHSRVRLGAIIEREGRVLLVPGRDDRLTIPTTPLVSTSVSKTDFERLLEDIGLEASQGFVYSVYEHAPTGASFIVYRCAAAQGEPRVGAYVPVQEIPYDRIDGRPTQSMLRRYAAESRLGNFGIYFGDHRSGKVHRPVRKDEP